MSSTATEIGDSTSVQLARIKVSHVPLKKGDWEGVRWNEDQATRCSNNVLSVPSVPCDILTWAVESAVGEAGEIVFDVAVDRPKVDDPVIFRDLADGTSTLGLPDFGAGAKGLYIVTRKGTATAPYFVVLRGQRSR